MRLPLKDFDFQFLDFKGLSGTAEKWLEFEQTSVIVGRNNVGKSALIDALRFVVASNNTFNKEWNRHGGKARYRIRQTLGEQELRTIFRENMSGGAIGINHWEFGKRFVGSTVSREFDIQKTPQWIDAPDLGNLRNEAAGYLADLARNTPVPRSRVFGIAAERNVIPEPQDITTPVKPDGRGLTNLIRSFLYDSDRSMSEIEVGLLEDLNFVFQNDQKFERILCRRDEDNTWEIYLETPGGAAIRLSQSGSSLKSIFIMLAAIRLNPLVDPETAITSSVFYVEEPENNLHPALLRRLLEFLAKATSERNSNLLISTHSPTAIDWASRRDQTRLFHIRRGDAGAEIDPVKEYGATRRVLDDLDVRASEILQSNGVIWVEGPTERIYLRKWIEILSSGTLMEGQHYSVMFYGGKLLAHLSCAEPSNDRALIDLLRMNRNLALIMDSDRRVTNNGSFRSRLNATKRRIIEEGRRAGGLIWTTDGREIENYISERVFAQLSAKPYPGKFESVSDTLSHESKISLAEKASELTNEDDLDTLDLKARLIDLVGRIRVWNGIEA